MFTQTVLYIYTYISNYLFIYLVHLRKMEHGLRMISAGIPYTLP